MSLHPPSPSKPNSNSSNALSLMTPTASSASVDTIILKHIPADPVSLDPSYSAPSKPTSLEIVADDTINISRNSPSWRAARESVLRQMVTAQDIPTPAITAKVNAKTGGRRGRGGRRSTVKVEKQEQPSIITNGTDLNISGGSAAERGKGKGRGKGGGRPRVRPIGGPGRGTKRKRGHNDDEDEASKDDTDASETFTPLPTQSRSGRRIFKASTFTPVIIDLEGPAEDKALTRGGNLTSTESRRKGNKRRRKPGDASVCKNCGRGHSPVGNMIVFCDGCNTPWHQYCHDQPIGVDVVRIEEKEWFCADCEVLREERSHVEGNVSAEDMTIMEKRRYLQTLSASHLVSLLLHATTLYPNLPIFSRTPAIPPSSAPPNNAPAADARSTANAVHAEDDTYDLYSESDPLPYPKAGNGVPLPPEVDDLAFLVDDDTVTFSHCWNWDRSKLFGKGVNGGTNQTWRNGMVGVGA